MIFNKIKNRLSKMVDEANKVDEAIQESNGPKELDSNKEIDNFILWYYINFREGKYIDLCNDTMINRIRCLIDKMAIWYELRYPIYELDKVYKRAPKKDFDRTMFMMNPYVQTMRSLSADIKDIKHFEWNDFYNTKMFLESLTLEERMLLKRPKYFSPVYVGEGKCSHMHLSAKGRVEISEYMEYATDGLVTDKELEGKHIKEVLEIFKKKNVPVDRKIIEEVIRDYESMTLFKQRLLECVMYRIIERGGKSLGPERGLLFAKEFGTNIDIPMTYGINSMCSEDTTLIHEYLNAGGSRDLVCYINYFYNKTMNNPHETVRLGTIVEFEEMQQEEEKEKTEKTQLRQRLVNVLAGQIDEEEYTKENVKRLRIERIVNKNKPKQ